MPPTSEGQSRLLLFYRGSALWQGLDGSLGRLTLPFHNGAAVLSLCPLGSRLLFWAMEDSLPLGVNGVAVGVEPYVRLSDFAVCLHRGLREAGQITGRRSPATSDLSGMNT